MAIFEQGACPKTHEAVFPTLSLTGRLMSAGWHDLEQARQDPDPERGGPEGKSACGCYITVKKRYE
jgi:hypothetical protein